MKRFGFTLIETIIASGAALVIGTLLVAILVNHNGVFYKQNSLVGEGLSLNEMNSRIGENIRQAAAVAEGFPENSPTYFSNSSTLVLKLPALSSSGMIVNVYDYIVVTPDENNGKILRLLSFPDSQSTRRPQNIVMTTILQSAKFSYLDKNNNSTSPTSTTAIGLQLMVLSKTGSVGSSESSSTVTSLRNLDQ